MNVLLTHATCVRFSPSEISVARRVRSLQSQQDKTLLMRQRLVLWGREWVTWAVLAA